MKAENEKLKETLHEETKVNIAKSEYMKKSAGPLRAGGQVRERHRGLSGGDLVKT